MPRIWELKRNRCRWPVGYNEDGEHLFCGCYTNEGMSYCGPHGLRSTASGRAPRAPKFSAEVVMPAPRREYLDGLAQRWHSGQNHEPDLVTIIEKGEDAFGHTKEYALNLARKMARLS